MFKKEFETEYEKILKDLFEDIHTRVIQRDDIKFREDYDPYLSGAVLTLVIKKDDMIYCANVGNVMAMIFFAERSYSYKFETTELTYNDSSFKAEQALININTQPSLFKVLMGSGNDVFKNDGDRHSASFIVSSKKFVNEEKEKDKENKEGKENANSNLHKNFDMNEELRRIYECGGEIRKLAGEDKSRIFVKGKYFPGLINTRSIGDHIGASIGISCTPHISKFQLMDKINYYLLMCTDGITNVLKTELIINLIENNDVCKILLIFLQIKFNNL